MLSELYGVPIMITTAAVSLDPVERNWRERWLTWHPWRPWQKIKMVKKPAMFMMGNKFICHPALKGTLDKMIKEANTGATEFQKMYQNPW